MPARLCTAAALLAGMAAASSAGPDKGRDAKEIYAQLCAACHGDGQSAAKASSLFDDQWTHGSEDAAIRKNIVEGIPSSGMPPFAHAVNEGEARALVVYLRETARRTVAPEPQGADPLPQGVQASELERYRIDLVAEGFNVPWSLCFLPGDRILVTERIGQVRLIENGRLNPTPIEGTPPVRVRDEGGLLAMAAAPDFAQSGWIYLVFSDPGPDDTAMTRVVRARLQGHALTDRQDIFRAPAELYSKDGTHFGSRLLFDGPYLFFTVGERGAVGAAQDLARPNGKVHRVFRDGRVPPDNPFVKTPGAVASIWSYGHRNPQGLALDPRTGNLWETEHGPRGGDELNRIVAGRNYGWPVITYGMNYDGTPVSALTEKEGMEQPAAHWTPSIATSPIHFYTGDKFPRWKHQLFLGSLAQQELRRIEIEGVRAGKQEVVFKHLGRVRDIQTGPEGALYVSLELSDSKGRIVRLVPER